MKLYCLLYILGIIISIRIELDNINYIVSGQPTPSEYNNNLNQHISTHNNKENFIAMFTKYTGRDGKEIYDDFIKSKRHKDSTAYGGNKQNEWEYNTVQDRFILSEERIFLYNI
jgi:hypothetical protein